MKKRVLVLVTVGFALWLVSAPASGGCGTLGLGQCPGSSPASPDAGGSQPRSPDPGGSELAAASVPPEDRFFGFSTNVWRELPGPRFTADDQARMAAAAGSNAQRILFDWQYAESAPNRLDLAVYDELYRELRARDIRPVITLANAPRWARSAQDQAADDCTENCSYPPAAEHLGQWREIAALLATRYREAAAIEIWNEPNLGAFWDPAPDPQRFVQLQREGYRAIKAANPAMTVVAGGFNNYQGGNPAGKDIPLAEFVDRAYAAGLKDVMDGLAFHPYPHSLDFGPDTLFAKSFADVRASAARHDDAGRPLWVTEVGLSTSDPRERIRVTPEQQADGLLRLYRRLMTMPDVKAVFLHELVERPYRDGAEIGFGLLRRKSDAPAKPAFCVFVEGARKPYPGCRAPRSYTRQRRAASRRQCRRAVRRDGRRGATRRCRAAKPPAGTRRRGSAR